MPIGDMYLEYGIKKGVICMWWIHIDGYIYVGDYTPGARPATEEEIENHLNPPKTLEQKLTEHEAEYAKKFASYDQLTLVYMRIKDIQTRELRLSELSDALEQLVIKEQTELEGILNE